MLPGGPTNQRLPLRRDGPVPDRVWAQAIHAVLDRRLSLRAAAQLHGLQLTALHRLVRQHAPTQLRSAPSAAASPGSSSRSPPSDNDNDRYVFPRLNPLALEQCSHASGSSHGSPPPPPPLEPIKAMTPVWELTPERNDEVVAVLREQSRRQRRDVMYRPPQPASKRFSEQVYERHDDGRRSEGYADEDIANVVRIFASRNGRRPLAADFPSTRWVTAFKRDNGFVDVSAMSRSLPSRAQQHEQVEYDDFEQQQYEGEQRDDQMRWTRTEDNRNYRQPPPHSPPQPPPMQQNLQWRTKPQRISYLSDDTEDVPRRQDGQQQRQKYYPQREEASKYRRSPTASVSSRASSDGSKSERYYNQSNTVPAKVWESAMEAVAIHGMSLRNAAKAHGVHFAALHRRLKKRQQRKLSSPCDPNYIPFEDEAGVVRVIHARAEMGVPLTFAELDDLLKRTALKHRSGLPDDIALALVRKFQSRVEQSVRHLVADWPLPPVNVLYQLRDTSNDDDDMAAAATAPQRGGNGASTSSTSGSGSGRTSGETGSLSPSGSSPSSPRDSESILATARVAGSSTWCNDRDNNEDNDMDGENGSRHETATSLSSAAGNDATASRQYAILRL
ncbi:hypothetical protein BBJ28_00001011 [Nothophytophthora sp. Chile5]|nr:hypothetical protein BBJ28_00001011 [Nothophytophthora sp. Chile5]